MSEFTIKDSGQRESFSSGMVRDTTEGKVNFLNVRFGPMLRRWAEHLTKGRNKYPDVEPGVPNWTLAEGVEEFLRAKESAERHFDAWIRGERDEDHAAGVLFNINLAEYVLEKDPSIDPGLGATPAALPTAAVAVPLRGGDFVRVKTDDQFNGLTGTVSTSPVVESQWDYWIIPAGGSGKLGFYAAELERVA